MSDGPRILYVAHGDVGETIRAAVDLAGGVPVEATGGMDAIKRIDYESVDAVVVPASLPDVTLKVFLGRADLGAVPGPPIVVGTVDRTPGPMIQRSSGVSIEALADRIDRAIRDSRLGDALDRHERLKSAFLRIAGTVLDTGDPAQVERIVYDELRRSDAYRAIWVGRVDRDDGTIDFGRPISRRVDIDEAGSFVDEADGEYLWRAIESGAVETTTEPVAARGGTRAASVGSAPVDDGLVLTAVPFHARGEIQGVALLATSPTDAPDATERSLLERLGRVCGIALAEASKPDDTTDRTGALVQVLAHELRNPLQLAGLSLESARADGDEEAFERLAAALETMASVVDATVGVAVGGRVGEVEEIDVQDVAVTVWRDVREPAAELTIARPATVEADRAQLERLLSNLIGNAIDHAGPEVSVRIGSLEDGSGFYVEDDGPGIDPGEREAVYEWGHSTREGGLGIGLAFVREIVEAHDWEISVVEGSEGGARFDVETGPGDWGPRDELAELFSGQSGDYEPPDATVE